MDQSSTNCVVCFYDYDEDRTKVITCSNGHSCCNSCYEHIDKCPMCREEISLLIPYDKENDLNNLKTKNTGLFLKLKSFLNTFIGSNFLRIRDEMITKYFTPNQMKLFSGIKHSSNYTLYRGTTQLCNVGESYVDKYISSWSISIDVAMKFGQNYVYCIEVDPKYIFIDLNFVYGELSNSFKHEKEVLLLGGSYKITSFMHKGDNIYETTIKSASHDNYANLKIPILFPTSVKTKDTCDATTLKGTKCKKNKLAGTDFCNTHTPKLESELDQNCIAITKKGTRCSFKAKRYSKNYKDDCSDYCQIHYKKSIQNS